MSKQTIHILPPHIVAQIAAGEVIERPAFVVKELLENAIDAKATSIMIHIEGYGMDGISVSDNGIGMSKDDALTSIYLHATSKLSVENDTIGSISSLGFRGEALASIAAISQLSIKTRQSHAPMGTAFHVEKGIPVDVHTVGMPIGTTITSEHLFSHIPARKQFLKTKQTEYRHILDVITRSALHHPEIHYVVTHNKKEILNISATHNLNERIYAVVGPTIAGQLIPIHHEESYFTADGYIVHPQYTYHSNAKIYTSINSRVVQDPLLIAAIKEQYGLLISSSVFPIAFITLSLPPESVDVNVHPRKEYVRFTDSQFIFDHLGIAIKTALQNEHITYQAGWNHQTFSPKLTKTFAGSLVKEKVLEKLSASKTILQIHNVYIIVASKTGFVIIDQHAAHERILYEKFTKTFQTEHRYSKTISLPHPKILDVTISEIQILEEHQQAILLLGFSFEFFGDKTIKITHIPELLKDRNPATLFGELISQLAEGKDISAMDSASHKMLTYISCRSAIKAGDPLTLWQMKQLLKELEEIPQATTCPHGRPIKINITLDELDTLFLRR